MDHNKNSKKNCCSRWFILILILIIFLTIAVILTVVLVIQIKRNSQPEVVNVSNTSTIGEAYNVSI